MSNDEMKDIKMRKKYTDKLNSNKFIKIEEKNNE